MGQDKVNVWWIKDILFLVLWESQINTFMLYVQWEQDCLLTTEASIAAQFPCRDKCVGKGSHPTRHDTTTVETPVNAHMRFLPDFVLHFIWPYVFLHYLSSVVLINRKGNLRCLHWIPRLSPRDVPPSVRYVWIEWCWCWRWCMVAVVTVVVVVEDLKMFTITVNVFYWWFAKDLFK